MYGNSIALTQRQTEGLGCLFPIIQNIFGQRDAALEQL